MRPGANFAINPAQALALFAELPYGKLHHVSELYCCSWDEGGVHEDQVWSSDHPTATEAIARAWAQWRGLT